MNNNIKLIHAQFVPSTYEEHQSVFLKDTPPQVISALYSIYPFLIAANRILSFITWTTESYYRNFVLISVYVLLILHWNKYVIIILPTLIALIYCCLSWFIKTSFLDTKRERNSPTLEEIIDTLDNFSMRFKFMFNFDLESITIKPLLINLSLITPFYVHLMKYYISFKIWFLCISLYLLIYYSNWFIALRRLLFRLKFIKQLLSFFTNESYSLINNEIEVTLINLNTKKTINANTKIIEFHILENERRWIGLGWCKKLLFFDRSPYCTIDLKQSFASLNDFQFRKLKNYVNSKWVWIDKEWIIEKKGWTYYDNSWGNPQYFDSITKYTRSRNLKRQCYVVLNK